MNFPRLVDSLDRFQHVLPALLEGLDRETVTWKPPSGNWSILEIVCHLADEEVEDFRIRVRLTLEDPDQEWPPIDPEGVAVSRQYQSADLQRALQRFLKERARSLEWLRSLQQPDWQRTRQHPRFGPIRAGEILAAWVAHDHLHTRQIVKRLFEISSRDAEPFSVRYAGQWTA
jgi:hypothetical protein